jgi:hypothetical protein
MEIRSRTSMWVVCEAAGEVRWNDAVFGLSWPEPIWLASGEAFALEDYSLWNEFW